MDRYSLPEVILKQPSTMKLPAYKTGAFGVQTRGGEGWWSDIDRRSLPPLEGYVETTVRDGAEALMEIEGSQDPLLATWRYGLGRVTALMTEPVGEGTAGWAGWRDYGRLLARVVSRTADDTRLFDYQIDRIDHEISITAKRTVRDSTLYPEAVVQDEGQRQTGSVAFREVAPGQFVATLAIDPSATTRLVATAHSPAAPQQGRQPTRLVSTRLDDVSPELQVDPVRGLDLEGLATATGGRYVPPEQMTAGRVEAPPPSETPIDDSTSLSAARLWPALLLMALALYLSEIIWRRWPRTSSGVAA